MNATPDTNPFAKHNAKMHIPLIALWLIAAVAAVAANTAAAAANPAGAKPEGAHLLVSKQFKENYIVHGRNLTVTLHLHNVGSGYVAHRTGFRNRNAS